MMNEAQKSWCRLGMALSFGIGYLVGDLLPIDFLHMVFVGLIFLFAYGAGLCLLMVSHLQRSIDK